MFPAMHHASEECMARKILRKPAVKERTGLSTAQIWRLEKAGTFPARVQISANAVGWYSDEIEGWIEARARGIGRRPAQKAAA
jgi:prophage regulatory protein